MNKKADFSPVLTIAGSDNSGGAGIQADLKTISALGCYGLSAVTAVTAQSSGYFLRYESISSQLVYDQITMSVKQSRPKALKTGMIGAEDNIYTIAEAISSFKLENLIIDPVLKSSTGSVLNQGSFSKESSKSFIECLKKELIPLSLVITPNRIEAEMLTGVHINSYNDIESAAKILLKMGARFVVIKGGHLDFDNEFSVDTFFYQNGMEKFSSPRLKKGNFHGTGCTFSAAVCSFIARGNDIKTAVKNAKMYVYSAMMQANPENPGILNHACEFSLEEK